jgi:hypothetical protein
MNEANVVAETMKESMESLWNIVVSQLPVVGTALFVFVVGIIISPVLGNLARRLINLTKVDSFAEKSGLTEQVKETGLNLSIAGLVGGLVKWFFLISFFVATVDILGWEKLTDVLYQLLFFIPNVIVAVFILTIGLILANLADRLVVKKIELSKASTTYGHLMGKFARWSITVFVTMTALHQLGIAQELIVILFAGIVLTISLAFGLGGRKKAAEIIERIDTMSHS